MKPISLHSIPGLLTICALVAQIGCQPNGKTTTRTGAVESDSATFTTYSPPGQGQGGSRRTGTTPAAQNSGPGVGGGGYETDNGSELLLWIAKDLAKMVRRSSPLLYRQLPKGWSQGRLANIIEKVRQMPLKDLPRDGRGLMFNWGEDAQGPYIEALRPFYIAYASRSLERSSPEELITVFMDIRRKLLHEVAHHLGYTTAEQDKLAEAFANRLLKALEEDMIFCKTENAPDWTRKRSPLPQPENSVHFVIQRTTGAGLIFKLKEDRAHESMAKRGVDQEKGFGKWPLAIRDRYQLDLLRGKNTSPGANFVGYPGPGVDVYYWEVEENPLPGDLLLRSLAPWTKTESLEVTQGATLRPHGQFIYTPLDGDQIASFAMDCRSEAKPVIMPSFENLGSEEKGGGDLLREERKRAQRFLGQTAELAIRMRWVEKVTGLLEKGLRPSLASSIETEYFAASGLPVADSNQRYSPGMLYLNQSFKVKDGRLCAVGVKIAFCESGVKNLESVSDSADLVPVDEDEASKGFSPDAPQPRGIVSCWKDGKPAPTEDIQAILPKSRLWFSASPENNRSFCDVYFNGMGNPSK